MGLRDRWRAHRQQLLDESVDEPSPGVHLFDRGNFSADQVNAFMDKCDAAGLEVDGLTFTDSYRVYARTPGTDDIKLPGEPGFLPLGDLSNAPAEHQAQLPPDYYERDWNQFLDEKEPL